MIENIKLIRSSIWLTASQISTTLISYLISIIVIKSLNVNEYADYGIVISFSVGLTILSYLGIPNIIQRYLPEKVIDKNYKDIISILISGFYLRSLTILIFLIISLSVVVTFDLKYTSDITFLSFVVFLYVAGKSFMVIIEEGLNALSKQNLLFILKTFVGIGKLMVIVWFLIYSELNVVTILIILGLFDLLGGIIAIMYLTREFKLNFKIKNFTLFNFTKTHIQFGFFNYLSQLQHFILSHSFEIIIISFIMTKNVVAEYTFAVTISSILIGLFPVTAIVKALYPLVIEKYYQNNSKRELADLLNEFIRFIAVVYSILAVFVIVNMDWIIKLLGKNEYLDTQIVIMVLFLFNLLSVLGTPFKVGLIILEDAKSLFKSNISFILVIILMPLSAYYFGIKGILIVAFFSLSSTIVFRLFFLRKKLEGNIIKMNTAKVLVILLLNIVFSFFLNQYIDFLYLKIILSLLSIFSLVIIYKTFNLLPAMLTEFISYLSLKTSG